MGMVVVKRLEAKEKEKRESKGKRRNRTSHRNRNSPSRREETYNRLLNVERDLEEETIKVKRIKVPLLTPYFHVAEKIIEKEIYLEMRSSAIKSVGIPQFNFRKNSEHGVCP